MTCKNSLEKFCCNLVFLKLKNSTEIFFGGTYFSPLVLPRNTSFVGLFLYPLQFLYGIQKTHWNVMLCFVEPASPKKWTTDKDPQDQACPSSYSLLALCMLISGRFTKASNGFLVPCYLGFLLVQGEECVLKCLYFRALLENTTQPLQHSCNPPQRREFPVWIHRK